MGGKKLLTMIKSACTMAVVNLLLGMIMLILDKCNPNSNQMQHMKWKMTEISMKKRYNVLAIKKNLVTLNIL